jgi:predicted thioesterase
VTVQAELLGVDGSKLRFKVEAYDDDRKLGEVPIAFSCRRRIERPEVRSGP